jgi:hypothetical protein
MNGGLTYKDLEELKAKAKARDEAVEYLRGLDLCGRCLRVQQILESIPTQEECKALP